MNSEKLLGDKAIEIYDHVKDKHSPEEFLIYIFSTLENEVAKNGPLSSDDLHRVIEEELKMIKEKWT